MAVGDIDTIREGKSFSKWVSTANGIKVVRLVKWQFTQHASGCIKIYDVFTTDIVMQSDFLLME